MKISIIAFLFTFLGLVHLAVSHLQLRRSARAHIPVVSSAPAPASTHPAAGIVDGESGGPGSGDYFTNAWTGENTGDKMRGTGACTAWRRTLQCNPSGPRDPTQDKGCQQVVTADESGFCECGDFVQFATVDCEHRPFTCEVMCLKFAVISGKQAVYRNQNLSPIQAKTLLDQVMWKNQTDLEAMKMMMTDVTGFMDRALQYTNETALTAQASMKKFLEMMKEARVKDGDAAAAEMAKYRQMIADKPWMGIYANGQKMIDAGRGIQGKVLEVLPFDPLSASKEQAAAAKAAHGGTPA